MTTSTSKLVAACLLTALAALIPLSSAQYYNNYYYPYNNYPYNYYNYNNYNNGGYGYNNGGYGYGNGYNGNNYYNYYSNGYYPYYNNYYSGGNRGYVYSPNAHHSLGMPNIGMSMGSLGGLFLSCSTKNCAG